MKKFISVMLIIAVLCSLAACGGKKAEVLPPAGQLFEDFQAAVQKNPDMGTDEIADALINGEHFPLNGGAMPVEEGWLNGFSEDVTGFESGTMFAPMIGSIPFVGYIFKLADTADADAFMAQLKEKADLRWNICTEADEMFCGNEGQTVFFVMSPASFD